MANEQAAIDGIDTGELAAPDADGLPTIETKYRQQMRQIVTQKIDLPVSASLSTASSSSRLGLSRQSSTAAANGSLPAQPV